MIRSKISLEEFGSLNEFALRRMTMARRCRSYRTSCFPTDTILSILTLHDVQRHSAAIFIGYPKFPHHRAAVPPEIFDRGELEIQRDPRLPTMTILSLTCIISPYHIRYLQTASSVINSINSRVTFTHVSGTRRLISSCQEEL